MRYLLTLSCREGTGIVHRVTQYLLDNECDIIDNHQFGDRRTDQFHMRLEFATDADLARLRDRFAEVAVQRGMTWRLRAADDQPRLLVMVSKADHCLNDLLYRWRTGTLSGQIALVVSNHPDLGDLVRFHGLPFEHVPVTEGKDEAERRLVELMSAYDVDLVVLARYMQILSDGMCDRLRGKAINIHHSYLPSFRGARPYHQAYERGVKLVGATAHYVTPDLDEGPIIEQELVRIDHSYEPEHLVKVGRDAECLALSRAVRWHCEGRVFLDGNRTVVLV